MFWQNSGNVQITDVKTATILTLQPHTWPCMLGLGLALGLFSALLDMFRTRPPMFDRLQRRISYWYQYR